jgi:hypothetical protein
MATSITTCGQPGVTVTGNGKLKWSYKTQAAAARASTSRQMLEAAERFALVEAELQCSCDNPACPERLSSLNSPFTTASSVERGIIGWIISLLGGKGWRAVVSFSYSAQVWCNERPTS